MIRSLYIVGRSIKEVEASLNNSKEFKGYTAIIKPIKPGITLGRGTRLYAVFLHNPIIKW